MRSSNFISIHSEQARPFHREEEDPLSLDMEQTLGISLVSNGSRGAGMSTITDLDELQ